MSRPTGADPEVVARLLDEAWTACTAIAPLSENGVTTVAEAYAVQQQWTQRRIADGDTVVGRKIGLTSRAVQRQMGIDNPDFGTLWGSRQWQAKDGRAEIPHAAFIQPRIEGELAFLIGDTPPKGTGIDAGDILYATAAIAPAVEIIDSRIADWRITLCDTVADNASYGGFVVGQWRSLLPGESLRELRMSLTDNGEQASTGIGADALGDPAHAVAWLANTLHQFDDGLRAGDIVLSGALGPVVDPAIGHDYTLQIGDAPPLTILFTREEA